MSFLATPSFVRREIKKGGGGTKSELTIPLWLAPTDKYFVYKEQVRIIKKLKRCQTKVQKLNRSATTDSAVNIFQDTSRERNAYQTTAQEPVLTGTGT